MSDSHAQFNFQGQSIIVTILTLFSLSVSAHISSRNLSLHLYISQFSVILGSCSTQVSCIFCHVITRWFVLSRCVCILTGKHSQHAKQLFAFLWTQNDFKTFVFDFLWLCMFTRCFWCIKLHACNFKYVFYISKRTHNITCLLTICVMHRSASLWSASLWSASLWATSSARLWSKWTDYCGGNPASSNIGADIPRVTCAHPMSSLPGWDSHCHRIWDWHFHLDHLPRPLPCWVSGTVVSVHYTPESVWRCDFLQKTCMVYPDVHFARLRAKKYYHSNLEYK